MQALEISSKSELRRSLGGAPPDN